MILGRIEKMIIICKLNWFFLCDVAWCLKERFSLSESLHLAMTQIIIRKRALLIAHATRLGELAYQNDKELIDNPYSIGTERYKYEAWRDGFIEERKYWEEDDDE